MKAAFLWFLFVVGSAIAAEPSQKPPALIGKLPEQADGPMQWGVEKHGIKIGLSQAKSSYKLNHRINIWIAYNQKGRWENGYKLGADTLLINNPDGSITTIPGDTRIDILGVPGMGGWSGGISDRIHYFIREPGIYKMQWKLDDLESGAISFTVVR